MPKSFGPSRASANNMDKSISIKAFLVLYRFFGCAINQMVIHGFLAPLPLPNRVRVSKEVCLGNRAALAIGRESDISPVRFNGQICRIALISRNFSGSAARFGFTLSATSLAAIGR